MYVDGTNLIMNDFLHGTATVENTIVLSPGFHQLVVYFYQNGGGETLYLETSRPSSPTRRYLSTTYESLYASGECLTVCCISMMFA